MPARRQSKKIPPDKQIRFADIGVSNFNLRLPPPNSDSERTDLG